MNWRDLLTGSEIVPARERGEIFIEPFNPESVSPNSYSFRLSNTLSVYYTEVLDPHERNSFVEGRIPPESPVLEPERPYLAYTVERLGGTVHMLRRSRPVVRSLGSVCSSTCRLALGTSVSPASGRCSCSPRIGSGSTWAWRSAR